MSKDLYVGVMFPYPSGEGIHIGHFFNYAIIDSYCNWKRYKGIKVFQPFGFDAFGLPAENYAKKHNRDPREVTYENIENFRGQMKRMNTKYEEKLVTSDPSYVKWTQWIFKLLYDNDLAYKKFSPVNYCSSCETVLANEQVKNDKCDRCDTPVEVRELDQWFFRITRYKDRLIKNLDWIDYPKSTIKQQRHWLENIHDWCVSRQRSWGCPIPIEGETDTLDTFVDSSFYYLRYCTDSDTEFCPKEDYKQVDLYVGGAEHSTGHLVFSRFINMVLFDLGYVPNEEPFKKVIHQGMITYKGEKMSKSKGNVVNPDLYDPDELRLFLSFVGPYAEGGSWDDKNIVGIRRFLSKFSNWLKVNEGTTEGTLEGASIDKLVGEINGYVEAFKFNKVVSSLMIFYNQNKSKTIDSESINRLKDILKCFAPSFK